MPLDLAIVIPVGPDDDSWRALLSQLRRLDVREVIVVFPTSRLAEHPRPELLDSRVQIAFACEGRAQQLNVGAAAARATWIWFLHADSKLTGRTAEALARHISRHESALGYFDLRFLGDGPALMALNRFGAWIRSRWLGLPFGDQGFLTSRRLFDRLQGFDTSLPAGEDHDFIWRARAIGSRIRSVGAPLYTSARKYAAHGWWRTTAHHLCATWQQAREFSRRART